MDTDPATGMVYFLSAGVTGPNSNLYRIDPVTGQGTHVLAVAQGVVAVSIAFHPNGEVYVSSPGPNLHRLDMATGATTWIGSPSVPPGWFLDMTCDSAGRLWATFDPFSGKDYGLYRIAVDTLTTTKMASWTTPHSGVAVGTVCLPESYCTAKTNSLGCVPTLGSAGIPSASASRGFEVTASNVRNGRVGLLLYGASGRAALPFGGGVLCLLPPFQRTPSVSSGGSAPPAADCTGSWSLDLNGHLWSKLPKEDRPGAGGIPFPAGTVLDCQWWGRDTPGNPALSAALEFTLCP